MKRYQQSRNLSRGEYILLNHSQNTEIAESRWKFIEVVREVLPGFIEQLRVRVYPKYARLAGTGPDYWESGWTFETWQLQSDRNHQLTPSLIGWARAFHAQETWILEGALETLSRWHRDPELCDSLDISGFRVCCGIDTLSSDEDRLFKFRHVGWDPQFQGWASFRDSIKEQFKKDLDAYEHRLRLLMESQGAVRARRRHSPDHFAWFALYQLGGLSAGKILKQRPDLKGDYSTILKGVKAAAGLLQWTNVR